MQIYDNYLIKYHKYTTKLRCNFVAGNKSKTFPGYGGAHFAPQQRKAVPAVPAPPAARESEEAKGDEKKRRPEEFRSSLRLLR